MTFPFQWIQSYYKLQPTCNAIMLQPLYDHFHDLTHWHLGDAAEILSKQFSNSYQDKYLEHFLWYCPHVMLKDLTDD